MAVAAVVTAMAAATEVVTAAAAVDLIEVAAVAIAADADAAAAVAITAVGAGAGIAATAAIDATESTFPERMPPAVSRGFFFSRGLRLMERSSVYVVGSPQRGW